MNWTEIVAEVDAKDVDVAGNIAQMTVPYGIYIEDYSNLEEEVLEIAHIDLIDEELLKMDRSKAKVHIYISPEDNPNEALSFLKERFAAENIAFRLYSNDCDVEGCLENWKKYFKPSEVGEKLLIRPIWRELLKSMLQKTVQCSMWAAAAVFYPLQACFWGQNLLSVSI